MKLKQPTPDHASAPAPGPSPAGAASAARPSAVPLHAGSPPPAARPVRVPFWLKTAKVLGFATAIISVGVGTTLLTQRFTGQHKPESKRISETEEAVEKLLKESKSQAQFAAHKLSQVESQVEQAVRTPDPSIAPQEGTKKGGSWFFGN